MKPTKLQLDAAVAAYNKRRETQDHADALRFTLQLHSKTFLTSRQMLEAAEAYADQRDPERWDGPPWGLAGQANHRAGILAALRTL